MTRDLALRGCAQSTQKQYLKTAASLIDRFGRPAGEISRDELRACVEELQAVCKSGSRLGWSCALCCFCTDDARAAQRDRKPAYQAVAMLMFRRTRPFQRLVRT